MKMFCLFGYVNYEGSELLGVFSSREKALAAMNNYEIRPMLDYWNKFDEFYIQGAEPDTFNVQENYNFEH